MVPLSFAKPPVPRRITMVGGGTAGHVYPALAIAAAYQRTCAPVDVLFVGTPAGFESRLVPAHGYPLRLVPGTPLVGTGIQGKLCAVATLSGGIVQARRLLRWHGTRLVIGLGGYASVGVLLAARSLGLRTVIHEANIVPGLANRLLGRFADRVYLGCAAAHQAFPADHTVITGNPVRPEILLRCTGERSPPCPSARPLRLLVTGGSQGAYFLNHHVPSLLRHMGERGLVLEIRHQVGGADPEPVRMAYAQAGLGAVVTPYIADMAAAYHWADFAIARSGAGTIAELAVCGLPALLVPLPNSANDHQTVNAVVFAQAGAGCWVREDHWHAETLAARLVTLFQDPNAGQGMSRLARRLATPDAAQKLVADCETMMAGQWDDV
jgi:UDP-N-acetylglucosamine--N-acetylmuramyl-(pentapeptide) pyrophosphoryl-undecaprenol N-acetylglucosamine transferase